MEEGNKGKVFNDLDVKLVGKINYGSKSDSFSKMVKIYY